jgi:hypothetical protein
VLLGGKRSIEMVSATLQLFMSSLKISCPRNKTESASFYCALSIKAPKNNDTFVLSQYEV